MKVTCYKLFHNYEEAKEWAIEHADQFARLRRADEKRKSMLRSEAEWEVRWYQPAG